MSQARNRSTLVLLTALMTMFALLVFPAGRAVAADIPVDCATENLQLAINDAPSGDTIIIADGTTCTGNFTVGKALTIRAATATGATLDGTGFAGAPVLEITAGTVTLQDLTIENGLNSAGDGGGIRVSSAALTLVDTTVTNNSAANGGGIWNDGPLTITDSFVTDNTATVSGGGIHNISGGVVVATGTEVSGNTAENAGGVLNNGAGATGSTVTFTNSVISGNNATGATPGEPAGGGGIYNFSFPADLVKAQLNLIDTQVINNTSAEGAAGIRNGDSSASLDRATITGNIATGDGGGIRTSGTMTVQDSDISGNSSTTSGGGISLDGAGSTLSVTGSTVNNNSAATEGGGISVAVDNTATVDQSSVTRNTAGAGAGFSNAGTLDVTNTTVSANIGTTQGGGILTSGDLTMTHATIATNNAGVAGEGGGIRVIGVPTVTLTGTILWGNLGNSGQDCSGPLSSGGYNLVGLTAAPCAYTGAVTDLPALSDPMPDALGFYGEATEHHPLMAGSDAIDAAAASCGLVIDQIGTTRPDGPACDVGAIEAASPAPPIVADEVLLVEPNGRWHIRVPGNPDYTFFYGVPGDIPLFGDWDGDGLDTPGAWRQGPGGGFAYLTNTLPPDAGVGVADFDFFFGIPGDEVFSGDWNGDNIDTLGINRAGRIFLTDTNGSGGLPVPTDYDFFFGVPGDRAFGGDGDGDGNDGVFLYRESDGFVYYTNETPTIGVAPTADNFFFGIPSDSFVSGDWNADLVDTAGIFRGSNGTIYLSNTNASGGAPAPTVTTNQPTNTGTGPARGPFLCAPQALQVGTDRPRFWDMSILVYGSLVPDIVFTVPRLPQRGEDVPARSVSVVAAGGGGNVAVALAGWGFEVFAGGNSVGDDPLGRWVAAQFAARGISTPRQFVDVDGVTAANGIIVTPDGERTIIGSDYSTVTWLPVETWDGIEAVMVDGYSGSAGAAVIARAAELGIPVVAGDRSVGDAAGATVLLWSADEHPDPAEATAAAASGPLVVVTSGPDPITVYAPDGSTLAVAPEPHPARDSTGAGDVFAAAVTAGLAEDLPVLTGLERAAHVTARYVATGRRSQIPPLTTLDL
jgi:predicted outer membrane repeat protein